MSAIANLFGYVLNWLYNLVQNYGVAIILFSVLLKIVMLPLSIKQQKSMKKSAKVQEEVNKLQVKYRNNPEMLNKEVMNLYKREKVSPFSGCLSSILQFIIFISVFYLVSRPLTYMKKVDPNLINDYSNEIKESGQTTSYPEIRIIELKSAEDDRVYINMNFLGLDLSKVPLNNYKDIKVFIIPLLYVIVTFVNIKLSNNITNKKKKEDKEKEEKAESKELIVKDKNKEESEETLENMQQMTRSMNYTIPIMSVAIALVAPLGLSLYWFISNVLQLLERIVVNKVVEKKQEEAN